jgi:hypothetical protein
VLRISSPDSRLVAVLSYTRRCSTDSCIADSFNMCTLCHCYSLTQQLLLMSSHAQIHTSSTLCYHCRHAHPLICNTISSTITTSTLTTTTDRRGRAVLRTLFLDAEGEYLCWSVPGCSYLKRDPPQSVRISLILEFRVGSGRFANCLYLVCASNEPLIIEPASPPEYTLLREGLQRLVVSRQLLKTDKTAL